MRVISLSSSGSLRGFSDSEQWIALEINMDYKVIFTENAMEDMDSIVEYLLFHLRNKQAANHFIDSVESGKFVLSNSAVFEF